MPPKKSDRSSDGSGPLKPRKTTDYRLDVVHVDVTKIRLMANPVRLVDNSDENLPKLRSQFMEGKYGAGGLRISVAVLGKEGGDWAAVKTKIDAHADDPAFTIDKIFNVNDVLIVDGQHRHSVLCREDVKDHLGVRFPANFYTRLDRNPMTELDLLFLGADLNTSAELVRKMSPIEHVFNALSAVRSIGENVHIFDDKTKQLIATIRDSNFQNAHIATNALILHHQATPHARTQTAGYSKVVAACFREPGLYLVIQDLLRDDKGHDGISKRSPITVAHLANAAVWDNCESLSLLKFRLKSIKYYFQTKKNKAVGTFPFSDFIVSIGTFYSFINQRLNDENLNMDEVLEMESNHNVFSTAGDFLASQCRSWDKANITRFTTVFQNAFRFLVKTTPNLSHLLAKYAPRRQISAPATYADNVEVVAKPKGRKRKISKGSTSASPTRTPKKRSKSVPRSSLSPSRAEARSRSRSRSPPSAPIRTRSAARSPSPTSSSTSRRSARLQKKKQSSTIASKSPARTRKSKIVQSSSSEYHTDSPAPPQDIRDDA
eukprot:IDg189t1